MGPALWGQTLRPARAVPVEAGQVVAAGFEPIAVSARRAVSLFLQEMPAGGTPKAAPAATVLPATGKGS